MRNQILDNYKKKAFYEFITQSNMQIVVNFMNVFEIIFLNACKNILWPCIFNIFKILLYEQKSVWATLYSIFQLFDQLNISTFKAEKNT